MLNITFTEPAELLKPIELIREPMPGKDAPRLTAERDARSDKNLPLSAPASRVSVESRACHHLGGTTRKGSMFQGPPSSMDEGWEAEGPTGSYAAGFGVFFSFSLADQVEKISLVFACLWRAMPCSVLMHEVCEELPGERRRRGASWGHRDSGECVKVTVMGLSPW